MIVIRRRWWILGLVVIALVVISLFSTPQPACPGCCRVYFN